MSFTFPPPPGEIVREALEADGFTWISNRKGSGAVLRSRTATGLGDDWLLPSLASYECRKFLRHLIGLGGQELVGLAHLAKKLSCSERALSSYLDMLQGAGLAERTGEGWAFTPNVDSFGRKVTSLSATVEWYIAYLFNHDLHWHATTNVRLQGTEYNDFDVLAVRGTEIAHVESKTSDPDEIPDKELHAFIERHYFLKPAFSLLLVDTSSSIERLASRLDQVLLDRCRRLKDPNAVSGGIRPIENSDGHVLRGWRNLYVGDANAKASNGILRTLRQTLRDYSTQVRGETFYE